MLSNERYKGRWHSLQTLQRLGNQFAPAGLVLNKFTVQNAFSISGRAFYAEYHFSDQLIEELSSPEGTILAVRRIRHQDATSGYFTVVGCYHIDHVPDEKSARLVDSGQNNLGRTSVRSEEPFNLPLRISSKDRGIMFLSELEESIFHKVEPPEEANPPIEEESESEEVQEESQPSIEVVAQMAVEEDAKPSIVIEGGTDDSNAGKGRRKRKPHRAKARHIQHKIDKVGLFLMTRTSVGSQSG